MEFQILKEREMKLLSRKRLTLVINNKGATPSRHTLIKGIADKFKVKENLVIIKHIYPQFGQNKTKLIVNIYDNKEKKELFEHKNLLNKHEEPKVEKTPEEPTEITEEKPVAQDETSTETVKENTEG